MYAQSITAGTDYIDLEKSIAILISNYELESLKEIKKAKEVLDELSQDEHERRLAELREKYIMDPKATEAAGYDKGLESGLKQGSTSTKIEIARKMISQGFDVNTIHQITELSIDEINNL